MEFQKTWYLAYNFCAYIRIIQSHTWDAVNMTYMKDVVLYTTKYYGMGRVCMGRSYGTNEIHIRVGLNIHMTFTLSSGEHTWYLLSYILRISDVWQSEDYNILIIKYLAQWIIRYMTVEAFIITCCNRPGISGEFWWLYWNLNSVLVIYSFSI